MIFTKVMLWWSHTKHSSLATQSQRAADTFGNRRVVAWGLRLLTIIDEALANVVDERNATAENLAFVIGHIPFAVRAALPSQVATLEQMHRVLLEYVDVDGFESTMSMLWGEGSAPACVDFEPLRAAMSSLPYDRLVYGRDNPKDRARLAARIDETLNAVQACLVNSRIIQSLATTTRSTLRRWLCP
jgi:hypothetical protein